jgi:hypothetical protein
VILRPQARRYVGVLMGGTLAEWLENVPTSPIQLIHMPDESTAL